MKSKSSTVTSVATSDESLFQRTIEFYEKLGFIKNTQWENRGSAPLIPQRSASATREVTLVLPAALPFRESSVTVRLADGGVTADQARSQCEKFDEARERCDWRDMSAVVAFSVDAVDAELLASATEHHQAMPPRVPHPSLATVHDPLGTLIVFSTHDNAVSEEPNPQNTKDMARAREAAKNASEPKKPQLDGRGRKIAVLTSGGDSPGMNSAVRAVVRSAIHYGADAYVVLEGYEGLVRGGDYIKQYTWKDVRGYLSIGGTSIGTARCMAFRQREGRLKAAENMITAGIDALVVCGGDGSLTGADMFRKDWPDLIKELLDANRITKETYEKHRHLMICGLVGSIDNDMALTDVTIGSYSSLDRICTNVDWIEATARSHSRAFVVEVMGRHCGWLALMTATATRADYVFIPEQPRHDWENNMAEIVMRHRKLGQRRTLVIVAEGAITTDLKPITSEMVKDKLVELGLDTRITTLGHVQRGGAPVAHDRYLATMQGVEAVRAVLENTPDTPSPMIGIKENKIVRVNLVDAVKETQRVAEAIERKQFDEVCKIRGAEYNELVQNYFTLANADVHNEEDAANEKLNVGIVVIGAPAGGMNSAVASAGLYCLKRGHTPYAFCNGWSGVARHGAIRKLDWLTCEAMYTNGGCEIGCNRTLPDCDMGMVAYYMGKYDIKGLIIIGGFEAYKSLHMLQQSRNMYPAFRIPMVCIPATISNNVPGTERSLGTDTCLNALVNYCDVVKQSASATRRRAFIVEVQGGQSGYIATLAGLICGAYAIYTPEFGISMSQMSADIRHLRECFAGDEGRVRSGRLVIRNEKASPGFTTADIAAIFETESQDKFDVRDAIPGHLQQGGLPSPIDRVWATRLGVRAIQYIEDFQGHDWSKVSSHGEAAVVLGVISSKITMSSIGYLWEYETEIKNRRGATIHWRDVYDTANIMTKRIIADDSKEAPLRKTIS